MKIVIYHVEMWGNSTWSWRFVDSNGNNGISVGGFGSEEHARTNVTDTYEMMGVTLEPEQIEVEE